MDTDGNLHKESWLFGRIFNTRSHKENKIQKPEKKGTGLNKLLIIFFSQFLCDIEFFNLEGNRNSFSMCMSVSAYVSACTFKEEKIIVKIRKNKFIVEVLCI